MTNKEFYERAIKDLKELRERQTPEKKMGTRNGAFNRMLRRSTRKYRGGRNSSCRDMMQATSSSI